MVSDGWKSGEEKRERKRGRRTIGRNGCARKLEQLTADLDWKDALVGEDFGDAVEAIGRVWLVRGPRLIIIMMVLAICERIRCCRVVMMVDTVGVGVVFAVCVGHCSRAMDRPVAPMPCSSSTKCKATYLQLRPRIPCTPSLAYRRLRIPQPQETLVVVSCQVADTVGSKRGRQQVSLCGLCAVCTWGGAWATSSFCTQDASGKGPWTSF